MLLWLAALPLPLAELLVDDEVPVVVVVAELSAGVELLLVVVVAPAAPEEEVEVQTTVLGTLTWLAWHSCWAKSMAFCWSAASHSLIRQQEIALMKSLLAQMQPISRPQLPMPLLRKMLAQDCWTRGGC